MTLVEAVAKRIKNILQERKMSVYRLEENSGINHGTMSALTSKRYKTINLKTIVLMIRALGMTVPEFFNDPLFSIENLDVDD